jgi:hypothetical protein
VTRKLGVKLKKLPISAIKNLGNHTANAITQQNAHFLNFKIEIKNFKSLKPPAGLQEVPSYAIESSKPPLNLVRQYL